MTLKAERAKVTKYLSSVPISKLHREAFEMGYEHVDLKKMSRKDLIAEMIVESERSDLFDIWLDERLWTDS